MSTGSIGQTQIRMVQPQGAPRIGQTTIRPTTPQIVRTMTNQIRPMTTIRGQTTIVQTNNQVPALHPVSGAIFSGGAQVRRHFCTSQSRTFVAFLTFSLQIAQWNEVFKFSFLHDQKKDERIFVFVIIFIN
jgi:hypothetical protein